ncbi:hypothetical protein K7I13_03575 [Brucepastera parasyntrophica]|uniref:hypothetical protein n=1 Tax=Brucepastera parasyntrophica TaxID=2880008 RepID=UPI00210A21A6|nr:hypothetical protein [Brucepastera parasyntrophica]ULQ60400.1 hypothetical protein K7I13_03575 [Brucepastera parasyntrophica]
MTPPDENGYPYSRGTAIRGGLLVDISGEAETEGIDIPVALTAELAQKLTPPDFLVSMGISLKQRIINLLKLVNAHIVPETSPGRNTEESYAVPFMVLRGPLVTEEFILVTALIHPGDDGRTVMTLLAAKDTDGDAA